MSTNSAITLSTFEGFCSHTDWSLLAEQKRSINNLIAQGMLSEQITTHLEGVIGFIDSIQDLAVDEYGIAESVVFPEIAPLEMFEQVNNNYVNDDTGDISIDGYLFNSEDGVVVATISTRGDVKIGPHSKLEYLESPRVKEAISEVLQELEAQRKD
ncbi:MAG: hypothetical protein IM631_12625 [Cytophagales bacterium]|nr:hypothetical protein [Cytophagales bacterium]MCA6382360.1 hypothetical protein [Cytophagales bacterium]